MRVSLGLPAAEDEVGALSGKNILADNYFEHNHGNAFAVRNAKPFLWIIQLCNGILSKNS
jgi:hypothetical protein